MFVVAISEAAKADMRSNALWWKENRSDEQADQWLSGIASAIGSLDEMPLRCPLAAEAVVFGIPIRNLYFGLSSRFTHRVLFFVDGQSVNILRVLSTKQKRLSSPNDLH